MNAKTLKHNTMIAASAFLLICGANKTNAQPNTTAPDTIKKHQIASQDSVQEFNQQLSDILVAYQFKLLYTLHELNTRDISLSQKIVEFEQCTTKLTEYYDSVYIKLDKLVTKYHQQEKTTEIIQKLYSINVRYEQLRQEILINLRNKRDKENQRFADSLAKPWKEYPVHKTLKRQKTR